MAQPFGITRAPENLARVANLTQWVALTYCGVYLPIFVEDCFLVELAETMPIAYLRVDTAIRMFGFELANAVTPRRPMGLL